MATQCTDRAKLDLSVMLLPYDDAVCERQRTVPYVVQTGF